MKKIIIFLASVLLYSVAMAQPTRRQFDYEQHEGDTLSVETQRVKPGRPKPDLRPNIVGTQSKSLVKTDATKAKGGWQPNGIVVCDTAGSAYQQICSDGQSGAIICWAEMYRGWPYDSSHTTTDVYAQRVDSGGNFVWQNQGVPVCSLLNSNASYPAMISDGQGGAIIAWEDDRGGLGYTRVFAQRLDSLGNRLWPENGVTVCNQWSGYVSLCSDGQGGAIITYVDGRDIANTQENIYAQRIDGLGNPAWQIDGLPVCTADSAQWIPHICYSNQGGAVITWEGDERNNGTTGEDVYAQLIDSLGNTKWTVNGEPLCMKSGMQKSINPVANSKGGGIINWIAFSDTNLAYAQSIDSLGNKIWGDSGVTLKIRGKLCSDDRGGGITFNGLVNRVDSSGNICWGSGISAHDTISLSGGGDVSEDRFGGVVTIWAHSTYLFAQRVDSSGNIIWNTTGVPVCTTMNTNNYQKVTGDMLGGAIATWYGDPLNYWNHVWVQKVRMDGTPGGIAGSPVTGTVVPIQYLHCSPNPFASSMKIQYSLNEKQDVSLNVYNISGQLTKTLLNARQDAGMYAVRWNGQNDRGQKVSNGIYFIRLKANLQRQTIKTILIK